MNRKKILFYSHDTFGLGHINRVFAIGQYISKCRKDVSVLLVSGSGIIHKLKIPTGIDYIKLPSVEKVGDGKYRSKYLPLSLKRIIKLREEILFNAALSFEPDVFVIDNVPMGLKKEAKKTLEMLRKTYPLCKNVLTMRDILDNPQKIKSTWKRNGAYEALNKYFDSVLVFGLKDIFDPVNEYSISEPVKSKFQFCGYLNRAKILVSPKKIRNILGINGDRFILVTVGGGGDGAKIIEMTLQALQYFKNDPSEALVVLGPDFPKKKEKELRYVYRGCKNIQIVDFVDNLPDFINAADLVISMGGYNTICEILSLKKKAIIVPRVRPRVEQLMRAQKLSQLGLLEYIHPDKLDLEILMNKIRASLLENKSFDYSIDIQGLEKSEEIFKELLQS